MKTVHRVLVDTGNTKLEVRYDIEKHLLYQQNRSRDILLR